VGIHPVHFRDLRASTAFYEKLGFKAVAGNAAQNWQIPRKLP